MENFGIKKYLEKFKNIIFQKEELYEVISKIISKNLNTDISSKDIKIKNTTIYIKKINPFFKNELLIKKESILSNIKKEVSNYNITNIN